MSSRRLYRLLESIRRAVSESMLLLLGPIQESKHIKTALQRLSIGKSRLEINSEEVHARWMRESEPFQCLRPNPDDIAIRSAILEGREAEAARLLMKVGGTWRTDPARWHWVRESGSSENLIKAALRLATLGWHEFSAMLLAGVDYSRTSLSVRRKISQVLVQGGQHERAIALIKNLISEQEQAPAPHDAEMQVRDANRLGLAELFYLGNKYLEKLQAPARTDVNGFVLIYNVSNWVLPGVMVPMIDPLMRRGYAVAAVTTGTLKTPQSGIPEFDALQWCITPNGKGFAERPRGKLSRNWRIDWIAGIVETGGINYFEYFQERLSQKARRYRADITKDPETAKGFADLHQQADLALDVCEKLLSVAKLGKPIRIAIMDSHFAPQGVIREWCKQVGRLYGIHAVALGVGYENYFSNLSTLEATTLAVEDLTAQPKLRQPFLGGEHRMARFLSEQPCMDADADEQVLSWVRQDRSKIVTGAPSSRKDILALATDIRAGGNKVFVALGKVSIDFAAPGDRGFAHNDFIDWILHIIEAVSGTENLLLVKPHPHEIRKEIVVQGVQLLRDLVPQQLPDNVLFLDHDAFNTHELADFIDGAFLWNGTAAVEFPVLGVPVFPASIWAPCDYPVGLEILRSRHDYEQVLKGRRALTLSETTQRRSAVFLRLMRSDHVAIPYRYLRRAATNISVGPPRLDVEELSRLERTTDLFVERAASRFFEFAF
jgi:hypothetical protein